MYKFEIKKLKDTRGYILYLNDIRIIKINDKNPYHIKTIEYNLKKALNLKNLKEKPYHERIQQTKKNKQQEELKHLETLNKMETDLSKIRQYLGDKVFLEIVGE